MSYSFNLSSFRPYYYQDHWLERFAHGKKYYVLDGKALIHDFFSYNSTLMEWEKKTQYYCGVEGSGKTNLIRFSTWVLNQIDIFQDEGIISVGTNDLRIFGDPDYAYLFENMGIVNIIGDDAIGGVGTNSAEFMHGSSIDVIKNFVKSRHIGKEQGNPVGIVFMTFATQSWKSLNPIIRENATLKVFTSYMDTDYFQSLFPFEETEFLREKHHQAHVSSNWKERKHMIFRTGAGGIGNLEVPLVPDCQEVLDWCWSMTEENLRKKSLRMEELGMEGMTKKEIERRRMIPNVDFVDDIVYTVKLENKEDFLKRKSHKNTIYIVDRSIDKNLMINQLADYLRSQPELQYLINNHPDWNGLEDFSRGKLKGVLQEEANRIEQKHCVKIRKTDLVSAIDKALKDELFAMVDRFRESGGIIEESDKNDADGGNIELNSIKDMLIYTFKMRYKTLGVKILHNSEISEITGLDLSDFSSVLSGNGSIFTNIIPNKGYWCLTNNMPTKAELKQFMEEKLPNYNKPMKKLKMEG